MLYSRNFCQKKCESKFHDVLCTVHCALTHFWQKFRESNDAIIPRVDLTNLVRVNLSILHICGTQQCGKFTATQFFSSNQFTVKLIWRTICELTVAVKFHNCNFHSAIVTSLRCQFKTFPWNQLFCNFFDKTIDLTENAGFSVKLWFCFIALFHAALHFPFFSKTNSFRIITLLLLWRYIFGNMRD